AGEETHVLWLAIATGRAARRVLEDQRACVIARVRSARGPGLLYEGAASDDLARDVLQLLAEERTVGTGEATLAGQTWPGFRTLYDAMEDDAPVERVSGEQSNTSIRSGSQLMLK